ncbi:ESAT-6-like protein [Mycobacteroides stephanolepidis]|uniref:ESAT-6-like protein n=1 Tax=[Mycobacterium] stephanolepidis TaxID=1520670 RepID=A0A1Z4EU99_9MYCO|nr:MULTISPECIES: WXG100 family type VII secretion target [Mycobacteroides]MBF9316929.1 WXG100 family type VII secretion target [Mycobacteroides chelonae]MBF9349351.1 WXG100 family type VII secretion target [Mycobacteroides chelonae]OHT67986.1 hypothetical protein BKG66_21250 [Mycobacteroides chelonae]OHT69857.1 hypothetical protein BKG67_19800 [Mycobacteroides chelonae]OHT83813.1 hypothetical protein BKG70_19955 [Mycobacteroides chelonae]
MGEADGFTVDLEELNSVVTELQQFTQHVQDGLDQLARHTAKLHLDWSGAAAEAHRQAHDEWTTGAQEMAEGLDTMRKSARNAHSSYQSAVDANTEMFR